MTGINFTGDISLGQLIPLVLFAVGAIGGYFTLRGRVGEACDRAMKAEAKAESATQALGEFKLEAARTFVQTGMLREVKDDLSREIRDIEHVVRGALMSALGNIAPQRRRTGAE